MQHRLNDIAQNRRLDMVLFVDFAVGHANKYSLDLRVPNVSESTVSTWHVDQLIKDYKASREVCVFIQEQL